MTILHTRSIRPLLLIALLLLIVGISLSQPAAAQDFPYNTAPHVYIWDATTGDALFHWDYTDQYPTAVTFSPDNTHVIVAMYSGAVIVYDTSLPRPAHVAEHQFGTDSYPHLDTLPQANRVLITGLGHFWVWDYAQDQVVMEVQSYGARLSPDGAFVLNFWQEEFQVFDVATGELISTGTIKDDVRLFAWQPGSEYFAITTETGFSLYARTDPNPIYTFVDDRFTRVYSDNLSWSPDGSTLMVALSNMGSISDVQLHVVDAASLSDRVLASFDNLHSARWSPDSRSILVTRAVLGADVIDATTGETLNTIDNLPFYQADWSQGGTYMVGEANDFPLYGIWNMQTGERAYGVPVDRYGYPPGTATFWSADRSQAAVFFFPTMDADLWNFADFTGTPKTLHHDDYMIGASWSPDGTRIATFTGAPIG